MFRKLLKKLFGRKSKKFNNKVVRLKEKGDTRYYYRLFLGDPRVHSISSFLPSEKYRDLVNKKTVSFEVEGKVIRFKDSFGAVLSEREEAVALKELAKVAKTCVMSKAAKERIDCLYNMQKSDPEAFLYLKARD